MRVHAKRIKVAEDVDFGVIARMASGASGAELSNIINGAVLRAIRNSRRFATQADLEESIEVVIAGYQKKNAIMTDQEKKNVAYHEIGHALVAATHKKETTTGEEFMQILNAPSESEQPHERNPLLMTGDFV